MSSRKKRLLKIAVLIACLILAGSFLSQRMLAPRSIILKNPDELLSALPSDAPLAVKVKRKNDLEETAREAPYLEVKDCKPKPLIVKVINKPDLLIKNSGTDNRVIQFNGKKYTIPALGEVRIGLDFAVGKLHPWYWYTCDKDHHTTGIVWVVRTYFLKPTFL